MYHTVILTQDKSLLYPYKKHNTSNPLFRNFYSSFKTLGQWEASVKSLLVLHIHHLSVMSVTSAPAPTSTVALFMLSRIIHLYSVSLVRLEGSHLSYCIWIQS